MPDARFGRVSHRAERLNELGALLEAGMDTDRTLSTIGAGHRFGSVLDHLLGTGLIQRRERPLLANMLEAGRFDRGLRLLAVRLRNEGRLLDRIKTRLTLPVAIWVMAILLAPLPALSNGDPDISGYAWAVFQPLILTAALIWLAFRYWRMVLNGIHDLRPRSGRPPGLAFRIDFLRELGELLASGLDAERVLRTLAQGALGTWRRRLEAAARDINRGEGLVHSLDLHGLLHRRHDLPVLVSAEVAGRLPQALGHQVSQLEQAQEMRMEVIGEWLPRALYFLILLYLARGLF